MSLLTGLASPIFRPPSRQGPGPVGPPDQPFEPEPSWSPERDRMVPGKAAIGKFYWLGEWRPEAESNRCTRICSPCGTGSWAFPKRSFAWDSKDLGRYLCAPASHLVLTFPGMITPKLHRADA